MRLRYRLAISVALIAMPWACAAAQLTPEQYQKALVEKVHFDVLTLTQDCGALLAAGVPLETAQLKVCRFFVRPVSVEPADGGAE